MDNKNETAVLISFLQTKFEKHLNNLTPQGLSETFKRGCDLEPFDEMLESKIDNLIDFEIINYPLFFECLTIDMKKAILLSSYFNMLNVFAAENIKDHDTLFDVIQILNNNVYVLKNNSQHFFGLFGIISYLCIATKQQCYVSEQKYPKRFLQYYQRFTQS
jgi:hypothetical protein